MLDFTCALREYRLREGRYPTDSLEPLNLQELAIDPLHELHWAAV
jgi:hypothetical protein